MNIIVLLTGYLLISVYNLTISISEILILASLFSIIGLITIVIFLKGLDKEPESQTFQTMIAVSIKVLLELILAFFWFVIVKKITLPSVLMFFILYLAFTLFSIWAILKILKNKSL